MYKKALVKYLLRTNELKIRSVKVYSVGIISCFNCRFKCLFKTKQTGDKLRISKVTFQMAIIKEFCFLKSVKKYDAGT